MCVIRTRYYLVDPADTDTRRRDAGQMEAAPATMPTPEPRAAMSLTRAAATEAEVIDGR